MSIREDVLLKSIQDTAKKIKKDNEEKKVTMRKVVLENVKKTLKITITKELKENPLKDLRKSDLGSEYTFTLNASNSQARITEILEKNA